MKQNEFEKLKSYFENKNVLVTGGAGFIGSHLVEALVELGAKVKVLDNLSTGKTENLKNVFNKIEFLNGSITDESICLKATKNVSYCFHLAATTSVPLCEQDPKFCHDINVTGAFNVLNACKRNNVNTFVFSSSAAVYGNKNEPCNENDACNPNSFYGVSKLIGENYCNKFKSETLITVILRYFNVWGPRQENQGPYAPVVSRFMKLIENNQPIKIFGDGKQQRDFIHVDDVVCANLKLCYLANNSTDNIFNIATGQGITIIELFNSLKEKNPDYKHPVEFDMPRSGEIYHSIADCSKFKNLRI